MKLHFSTQPATSNRFHRIKSVAKHLNIVLTQVPHETTTDLTALSPFNTLPLLETPDGTFFSTNTIVRYLANTKGGELYGGDNLHNKALVDQWLDVVACDLEAAVAAVIVARDGKEVDTQKVAEDINKFLAVIEARLNGKKHLVGEQLSLADITIATCLSVVMTTLLGQEERKLYPNLTAWYVTLATTDALIGSKDLSKDAHKAFKGKKEKVSKEGKKQDKKEEKKPETKVQVKPAADEDDLFGQDSAPSAPKPKPQPVKPKKEKPAAKSMIVFDVKVYEMQTDLIALFQRIKKQIVMDGLVWNNEPKILPIAFGMNKLQCGCVVEDAKVSVDDIYEKIESWDDIVQSIDTVNFQKL